MKLSRNAYCLIPEKPKEAEITEIVLAMINQHPDYGFRKLHLALRESGYQLNHKRLYRIYCQLGLNTRNLRNSKKSRAKQNSSKTKEEDNEML